MRVKENRKIARKKPLVTNTNASKMPRREETMGYKYIKKMCEQPQTITPLFSHNFERLKLLTKVTKLIFRKL